MRPYRLAAIALAALLPIYATPAMANCMLVGLGSSMSLITCSGGVKGNAIGLGHGLTSYRLSSGTAGMLNLLTSSASANAAGSTASTTGSESQTTPPAPHFGVPIIYLFAGSSGSPATAPADAAPAGGQSLHAPIDQPLMPPMTDVATSQMPAPMAQVARHSGPHGPATPKARALSAMIAGGNAGQ